MKKFIISIDAGTTSNRSILFDLKGKPVFSSQKEFTQYFPKSGWVEHNPEEIWSCLLYTSPSPRDLSTSRMPSSA